jgi:hypothetical protein
MPNTTYNNSYEVQVSEGGGFPTNNFIAQVSGDITQTVGGPTTFLETPNIATLDASSINLSKTRSVVTGPFLLNYRLTQFVTDLMLSSTLSIGPGSDVSSELNTIIEPQQVQVPEPVSVIMLGIASILLLAAYRRVNRNYKTS